MCVCVPVEGVTHKFVNRDFRLVHSQFAMCVQLCAMRAPYPVFQVCRLLRPILCFYRVLDPFVLDPFVLDPFVLDPFVLDPFILSQR